MIILNIIGDSRRRDISNEPSIEQSPEPRVSKFSPERDLKSASDKKTKLQSSAQKSVSPKQKLQGSENKKSEDIAKDYEEKLEMLNSRLKAMIDSEKKLKEELDKLKKETKRDSHDKENQQKSPEKFNKEFEKRILQPLAKTLQFAMFKSTPKKDIIH